MRRIKELTDQIREELEGAKGYAESYLDFKAAGDSRQAGRFQEMAQDELKHAGYIHDLAVTEIDKLRTVYTPPADMEEAWNLSHKRYIEQAAWVRQMLAM